jgi:hypothetical protein
VLLGVKGSQGSKSCRPNGHNSSAPAAAHPDGLGVTYLPAGDKKSVQQLYAPVTMGELLRLVLAVVGRALGGEEPPVAAASCISCRCCR